MEKIKARYYCPNNDLTYTVAFCVDDSANDDIIWSAARSEMKRHYGFDAVDGWEILQDNCESCVYNNESFCTFWQNRHTGKSCQYYSGTEVKKA
jgi:hypothetical protein